MFVRSISLTLITMWSGGAVPENALVRPVSETTNVTTVGGRDYSGVALLLKRHDDFRARALTIEPARDFAYQPMVTERAWKHVVIHHSASEIGSVEMIHQMHLLRKDANGKPWRGIGYHFVIGNGRGMEDGQIEATFRWTEQSSGAHAGQRQYNDEGIGICLIGNFEHQPPTEKQLESLVELIKILSERYGIPAEQIVGHRDVKATACPGRLFPFGFRDSGFGISQN